MFVGFETITVVCWVVVFYSTGRYVRTNLNMPVSLPMWSGGHRDYNMDTPITVFGSTQARIVGMWLTTHSSRLCYLPDSISHVSLQRDNNLFPCLSVCLCCRRGVIGEQHSDRLCVLFTLSALCPDCSEHPQR